MLKDELPEIVTGTVPGAKAKELLERRNAAVPKALCGATYPICIARGEGAMVEDLDGNKFLDWIGGVGVLNMGYSRPEVVEAVKAQAEKYFHTIFNVIVHDGYVELAEKFNQTIPCRGDKKKTYFANSGAEADENAIKVAKYLKSHDKVAWVNSPSLEGDKYYELAQKYMPNGTCGVITFGLKGGRDASVKMMDSLKMVAIVTHVADARSCVLHPASHTHRQMNDQELLEAGVQPDLIRFSVGIENVDDIITDVEQALAQV